MNCDEARLQIGAHPAASTPELEEHVRGCSACAQFRSEMRTLDADIHRAMQKPPDVVRRAARRAAPAWRQWAVAAGAALATFLVLTLWLLRPTDTLARDVVQHVQGEPDSWQATQQVSVEELNSALQNAGVALEVTSDKVVYAQSCWFRGHYVPHLVVQTAQGPVTVMILRHVPVRGRQTFSEEGMSGMIVPAEHGSIAVLARGNGAVDAVATQMNQDMRWMPEPTQPPSPPR
jgi:HAMP domain-containing protein